MKGRRVWTGLLTLLLMFNVVNPVIVNASDNKGFLADEIKTIDNGGEEIQDPIRTAKADYGLRNPRDVYSRMVWDCVWFGSYYQDDITGQYKEPIKWRVLSVNGNDALVMSEKVLEYMQFHKGSAGNSEYINWAESDMRLWLNSVFYEDAFTEFEKMAIRKATKTYEDMMQDISIGTTTDKIFLPSLNEVYDNNYGYGYNYTRYADHTDYAARHWEVSENKWASWWTRTTFAFEDRVINISESGKHQGILNYSMSGVRPILHLDLSQTNVWSYAGTVDDNGNVNEVGSDELLIIGRDNNSFIHSASSFFNAGENKNYFIYNSQYLKYMWDGLKDSEKIELLKRLHDEWEGSCYGLSFAMAYSYMNYIDISELGETNFYSLPKPKNNKAFRDLIQALHLAQYRSDRDIDRTIYRYGDDSKLNYNDFFKLLIKETEENIAKKKPILFSCGWKEWGKSLGHRLIICGYNVTEQHHVFKIVDPNETEAYIYLYLSKDYKEFYFSNLQNANENNWTWLSYNLVDKTYYNAPGESLMSSKNVVEDFVKVTVNKGDNLKITSGNRVLEINQGIETGDLKIIKKIPIDDDGWKMIYILENSPNITITSLSNELDVDVVFENNYYGVSGTDIKEIDLNGETGITLNSNNKYDFKVFMNMHNINEDLVSLKGETKGKVVLSYNEKKIDIIEDNSINNFQMLKYTESGIEEVTSTAEYINNDDLNKPGEKNEYIITFNPNSGKVTTTKKSVTKGQTYGTLPISTRSKYTFKGWYTAKSGGTKIIPSTKVNLTTNQTLYAQWDKVVVKKTKINKLANMKGKKAKINIKKVSGADGYQIVYSTSKKFKKSAKKTTTKKTYTLKKLKKGRTYYVKVRAYKKDSTGAKVYGKYSAKKKVTIKK